MSDFLKLTDLNDLRHLRDLYYESLPDTSHGYHTLNNYVRWFELNPKIDHVHVYVFHNWKESGFFLILDYYHVLINTLYMSDDDLKNALKLLDWTREYKIYALPDMLYAAVEEALQKDLNVNFKCTKLKIYQKDISTIREIKDAIVPDYLEARPLSIEDANIVNDTFDTKQEGSLEFIKSIIKYNLTIGLYDKESNELVAWITRCHCGFLDILRVTNQARGRGLAALLMELYAQKLQELREDVRTMLHETDFTSQVLFSKLDSRFIEDVLIIYTLKKFR